MIKREKDIILSMKWDWCGYGFLEAAVLTQRTRNWGLLLYPSRLVAGKSDAMVGGRTVPRTFEAEIGESLLEIYY